MKKEEPRWLTSATICTASQPVRKRLPGIMTWLWQPGGTAPCFPPPFSPYQNAACPRIVPSSPALANMCTSVQPLLSATSRPPGSAAAAAAAAVRGRSW
eukprot:SAG22_NODE_243_length_14055_cov_3.073015_18_plen_98_part_01